MNTNLASIARKKTVFIASLLRIKCCAKMIAILIPTAQRQIKGWQLQGVITRLEAWWHRLFWREFENFCFVFAQKKKKKKSKQEGKNV